MAPNSFLDENTSHNIQGSGGFANLEKGETETFGRCGKGKGENSGLFQENFRSVLLALALCIFIEQKVQSSKEEISRKSGIRCLVSLKN